MQSEPEMTCSPQQQSETNELLQPSEHSGLSRKRSSDVNEPFEPPSNTFDVLSKTMHEMQQPSCSQQHLRTSTSDENQFELAQGPQTKSERVALSRSNETAERRASRLQANAERARLIRLKESAQQRAQRLAKDAEKKRKRRSDETEEERLLRLRNRRIQRAQVNLGEKAQEKNYEQSSDPHTISAEDGDTINATQCFREEATCSQNLATQADLMQCSSERRVTTLFYSDDNKGIRHGSLSAELHADEQDDAPATSNSQVNMVPGKSSEVTNSQTLQHNTEVRWNDTNDENCYFPVIQNLEVDICESERAATPEENESAGYVSERLPSNETIISQRAENQQSTCVRSLNHTCELWMVNLSKPRTVSPH
ncbi:unnamed protein product [Cylicocyclus nassatus]|uniref:Uncharacterized protein n=1 Tax=Cylicocyclus nassatus TaxID=53992 RepID=A0AA36GHD6_CYLNA|nr:unnamed protein product [Cylicocyclus nassatus]